MSWGLEQLFSAGARESQAATICCTTNYPKQWPRATILFSASNGKVTNWGRAVLVTSAPHMAGSGHFEDIWLGGRLVWRVLDVFTHSRCR